MKRTETNRGFRSMIAKFTGLLVAPFAFTAIIVGVLWLIANLTLGDIMGYASILFMRNPTQTHQVSDFLEPAKPGEGTADTINIADITFPTYEQVYGEISIESVDLLCPLVYGDTDKALKKGAGQYIGSSIIGYGGTTMICAHVNRQFKNLHKTQVGDTVQIRTAYGVYTYEVKYTGVHDAEDDSIYDLADEAEKVVLYTCYYQQTALGSVKKRFFVCADYVSGPMIKDWGDQQ